jgi:hypothetical protein
MARDKIPGDFTHPTLKILIQLNRNPYDSEGQ